MDMDTWIGDRQTDRRCVKICIKPKGRAFRDTIKREKKMTLFCLSFLKIKKSRNYNLRWWCPNCHCTTQWAWVRFPPEEEVEQELDKRTKRSKTVIIMSVSFILLSIKEHCLNFNGHLDCFNKIVKKNQSGQMLHFFIFLILVSFIPTKIYMLKSKSQYDYIWRQSLRGNHKTVFKGRS